MILNVKERVMIFPSVVMSYSPKKLVSLIDPRGIFLMMFSLLSTFKIMTDKEVLEAQNLNILVPNSLNAFLGNTTPQLHNANESSGFFSQRLQFNPIKYLFIKSTNLGTFNTLGSFGERTVIKKVPVIAPQGEMILDDTRSGNDMLSCEKQSLKRLEFQVTDELGNTINLQGHDISFSLICSIMP